MSNVQYAPFKARLVMGSIFDINTKDHQGAPLADEAKHHYFLGFAVPKGPEWDAVYATMFNAAAQDPSCTQALCQQPGFNWKIEDCDAPADPSKLGSASRPAGHMLIKFTRYNAMGQPPVVDGRGMPLTSTQVKRGDWFYVAASTKFNGAKTVNTNAGMYQNLDGLMFAETGEEIVGEGGFNATSAFAGIQGGMAPQAAAPVGGVPMGQPAAPVTPQAANPAPVTPQASAPTATPPPVAAPVTPVKVYVHTDPAITKEQYQAHDAAWTEDLLVTQGKGRWEEQAPVAAPVAAPVTPAAPSAPGVQPAHDFLNQPGVTPQ
ncbi:Gp2.5-like ssDNA binding protein and ssDNA anneal ing protein [Vibrio phage 234P10]